MSLYVKKIMSKKNKPFLALVGEDVFGQCFISFDPQVIMRISGLTAADLSNLDVGGAIMIGEV